MEPAHPEWLPDPSLSREEMEALQNEIADAAVFSNEFEFDPATVSATENLQNALSDTDAPIVLGVDGAFLDDRAIGAIVALRDGDVIERVHAVVECAFPYVPGLLSFREAGAIVAAFEELDSKPDLAVFDGSGRIHFRQAGLATHLGALFDLPSIGVAKGLLCGDPQGTLDGLATGERVEIHADGSVNAPVGTLLGHALQTRQYDDPSDQSINPVYVSPGHRVDTATATDLVEKLCAGYKLPEPTRRADGYADEAKRAID